MSPDLAMCVLIEGLTLERAETIARATQIDGTVPLHAGRRRVLFRTGPVELGAWQVHDLLTGAADWNAPTWDTDPAALPRLVRTFEILYAHVPEAFAVEVLWGGDRPEEHRPTSREAMLELVRQGQIGTRTRYLIAPAGA